MTCFMNSRPQNSFDIAGISVLGRGGYFDKVQRGWMMERQTFLLSIEDPQDTGQSFRVMRTACTFDLHFELTL